MRVGIDIDDTITNTWDYLMPYYEKIFKVDNIKDKQPYYRSLNNSMSLDEYNVVMQKVHDKIDNRIPIRKDAIEIINKLHDEGHYICFITARGMEHMNLIEDTIRYLFDCHIPFDKLYVSANDKGIVCQNEKIDLFIDDSCKHLKQVSKYGIEVLMIDKNYNKDVKDFRRVKDWYQIYEYIKRK